MKKIILLATMISLVLISCSDKKKQEPMDVFTDTNITVEEPKVEDAKPLTVEEEGLKLIEGTDCLSCHKTDAKLVGPSYQDVANKYSEADIDYLAQKIIEGGKGVWGDVPMSAHKGMSNENAQKMVKYILSLKK